MYIENRLFKVTKKSFYASEDHRGLIDSLYGIIPDNDFDGTNGIKYLWDDAKKYFQKHRELEKTNQEYALSLFKNKLKNITTDELEEHDESYFIDIINAYLDIYREREFYYDIIDVSVFAGLEEDIIISIVFVDK